MVTALFRDRESAECAYRAVSGRGYGQDEVNLMMSDETRAKHYSDNEAGDQTELGNKALEGTGVGMAAGGTIGAVIGAVAAVGTSIVLPGLGLVVAGPIAGALAGAGAGGLTGGLIGALAGWGVPEEEAREYESGIKGGGMVLGVHPRNAEDSKFFQTEWKSCGGVNIYAKEGQHAQACNSATADRDGKTIIPVVEEELHVGKRKLEGEHVSVATHVEEKPVEKTVNLREEQITVDRRPVDRPLTQDDAEAIRRGTLEVKTTSEKPVVAKEAHVVEEVVIDKNITDRSETISDTVRKTKVDVDEGRSEQAHGSR